MKKTILVKIGLLFIIGCMTVGMTYGATGKEVITEEAFIKELLQLGLGKYTSLSGGDLPLTRERAAVLIVNSLGYEGISKEMENRFKDVIDYKGEINLVCELGFLGETGNDIFSPKQTVSYDTARIILQRLTDKLNSKTNWSHACYAIQSSSQMEQIKNYNAVSFGWAELKVSEIDGSFVLSTNNLASDFKVPSGFEKPIDFAKANSVETYLMIYLENKGESAYKLLTNEKQRTQLITELIQLVNGVTKDGQTRSFDGLTIDFEQFKLAELKSPYVTFLKELKDELKKLNKKLNVAVQPTLYFKGYDYKGISEAADHVILMSHDYATKSLSPLEQESGVCMTPVTPINRVYTCLKEASEAIADKSKIVIQISFDSRQWQLKDNRVIHSIAYTPSYNKIDARLKESGTNIFYDTTYQNPYAHYTQDGIKNVMWYENQRSIEAKITLAKLLGITNTSYWRLGIIQIL